MRRADISTGIISTRITAHLSVSGADRARRRMMRMSGFDSYFTYILRVAEADGLGSGGAAAT